MREKEHKGWYKSGNLPHFDEGGLYQFITYRLNDSVPEALRQQLENALNNPNHSLSQKEMVRRKYLERLMDAGYGSCALQCKENAQLIIDAWQYFNGRRYDLHTGVVMPNHVHLLVRVYTGVLIGNLVQSWKSFTSRRFVVDEHLGYRPQWQRGYWDRYIRNEAHYQDALRYIINNPVEAGLVRRVEDWPYYAGCVWPGASCRECWPGASSSSSMR